MNTHTAIAIAALVAELTDLVTRFQVQYGKLPHLTPDSSINAFRLHRAIFAKQRAIAHHLSMDVLADPTPRWPWWKHQATMDVTTAGDLSQEVNHLIACCAYFEVDPDSDLAPAIHSSEAAIAGMLHPEARLSALKQLQQGYALDHIISLN